jgi:hypothetical protein
MIIVVENVFSKIVELKEEIRKIKKINNQKHTG